MNSEVLCVRLAERGGTTAAQFLWIGLAETLCRPAVSHPAQPAHAAEHLDGGKYEVRNRRTFGQ